MNTDQILTFIEVASRGNFTKAASSLYKTQPVVSRTIATIENELGVQLLTRRPHQKVELTESGQIYYDVFVRFRDDMNRAANACKLLQDRSSMLRVGHAPYWVTSNFLPQIYSALNSAESPMNITVECHEFGELSRRVYEDFLDMAITVDNSSIAEYNLSSVHLCSLPKVIVYSNALKETHGSIDASALSSQNFLLYNHPYFNLQKRNIEALSGELGYTPSVKSVVNIDTLNSMLLSGQGVVVLDNWSQQIMFPSLGVFPLKSSHEVCLIYRNDTKYMNIIEKIHSASF